MEHQSHWRSLLAAVYSTLHSCPVGDMEDGANDPCGLENVLKLLSFFTYLTTADIKVIVPCGRLISKMD